MKKFLSLSIVLILILSFVGCQSKSTGSKKEIVVGASPTPHAEILNNVVKPILAKQGYTLKVIEFSDYVQPNLALADGQLDANFFQHVPYLTQFCKDKNLDLDYTVKVHLEPMGVYSKKLKSLNDLKDGAVIGVPNDPTNEARALRVLETAGVIKIKSGELVTKLDITENKKNIKIKELDAPQLPVNLQDFDAAVINSNYALPAGLNPTTDAIAVESKDSPYANVLAVKKKDKDKDYIKALSNALNSKEVKDYIEKQYKGAIIPAF